MLYKIHLVPDKRAM